MASVLESLAMESGKLEDSFDVEEFCEMLTAYFPGFESIPHALVTQWIFDLVDNLRRQAEQSKSLDESSFNCIMYYDYRLISVICIIQANQNESHWPLSHF